MSLFSNSVEILNSFTVYVNMNFKDLFDHKGNRNKVPFPQGLSVDDWDGSKPRFLLSQDGVVLVAAFPKYFGKKAHVSSLIQFRELR